MSSPDPCSQEILEERQNELREILKATRRISVEDLSAEIRAIGFKCVGCGECCVGEDNNVVVFPFEIRQILEATNESWLGAVEPPTAGEWDCQGNFHTLEWRIKKEEGSCKFYAESGCRIYQARPMLCKTYPFYLDIGALCCSECRGLGMKIDYDEALKIAASLIERSITEIQEAIALLEKYLDFKRGRQSENGVCIVHDSEGAHSVPWKELPDFHRRLKKIWASNYR